MTQTLESFLTGAKNKEFAIQTGTQIHAVLQHVIVDDAAGNSGALELIEIIDRHKNLKRFFAANAQTEVPIAGYINGRLISRRIDRIIINHNAKTIDFIDYKTDIDKKAHIDQYKHQLNEYQKLLQSAYPEYKINGYILWIHDWSLEQI